MNLRFKKQSQAAQNLLGVCVQKLIDQGPLLIDLINKQVPCFYQRGGEMMSHYPLQYGIALNIEKWKTKSTNNNDHELKLTSLNS